MDIGEMASSILVVAPVITLCGTAFAYVLKLYLDREEKRQNDFFKLMQFIDSKELPIATKMTAVYQLRRFREHKDFVIRFAESQRNNITGPSAEILSQEIKLTEEFMKRL